MSSKPPMDGLQPRHREGPYGRRRLQPVGRLPPRHGEMTPANCVLTM